MNVVWLASWFPSRINITAGDFIERHAQAVAPYITHLSVIVVLKDAALPANMVEIQQIQSGNLTIYRAYYGKSFWSGIIGKLLSQKKYLSLQDQFFKKILSATGKPDLVHVQVAMKAGVFARKLKKKWGIPYIVTEHWSGYKMESKPNIYDMGKLFLRLNKAVLKDAALLLPVSQNLANTITNNFVAMPYRVVPNVVDTKLFFYTPSIVAGLFQLSVKSTNESVSSLTTQSVFRFIHPSYMNYPKNPEGILQACKLLKESGYRFELQMIGNKDASLMSLAVKLGLLNDCVFFEAEIAYDEVAKRMQQSNALLMFSRYENLPCIILEALCCGLPVVSSRVGGIAEVVNDSNGILVDAGNIDQLVKAMQQMIETYESYDRRAIATAAAALFSYETVGKTISDIYQKLLQDAFENEQ
jgi:glycosyltransferase involved in cell wall biosynthesis